MPHAAGLCIRPNAPGRGIWAIYLASSIAFMMAIQFITSIICKIFQIHDGACRDGSQRESRDPGNVRSQCNGAGFAIAPHRAMTSLADTMPTFSKTRETLVIAGRGVYMLTPIHA